MTSFYLLEKGSCHKYAESNWHLLSLHPKHLINNASTKMLRKYFICQFKNLVLAVLLYCVWRAENCVKPFHTRQIGINWKISLTVSYIYKLFLLRLAPLEISDFVQIWKKLEMGPNVGQDFESRLYYSKWIKKENMLAWTMQAVWKSCHPTALDI